MEMAPNLFGTTGVLLAEATIEDTKTIKKQAPINLPKEKINNEIYPGTDKNYKWVFVWRNTLAFIYLHTAAIFGLYLIFTKAHSSTILYC